MNKPVGGLPFAPMSEPAAAKCAPVSATPSSSKAAGANPEDAPTDFEDLLESEIDGNSVEKADQEKEISTDPWAFYGFAVPIPLLQQISLAAVSGEGKRPAEEPGSLAAPELSPASEQKHPSENEGGPPLEAKTLPSLLQLLRPAQQIVP